jgi:hypothetical protein
MSKQENHFSYDPSRRVPRGHKRVVRKGTEKITSDFSDLATGSVTRRKLDEQAEDQEILREIPPHWSTFYAENDQLR